MAVLGSLLTVATFVVVSQRGSGTAEAIAFGDKDAKHSDYPFVARLNSSRGLCSAVVIAPQWLLSAGHCAHDAAGFRKNVPDPYHWAALQLVGQAAGAPSTTVVRISAVRQSPNVDLALFQLEVPVAGLAPITIASEPPRPRTTVGVAGFGNQVTTSAGLFAAGEVSVDRIEGEGIVSVASAQGARICKGDSGGPMFTRGAGSPQLLGIHSAGADDKCTAGMAMWGVRTDNQLRWITDMMSEIAPPDSAEPHPFTVSLGVPQVFGSLRTACSGALIYTDWVISHSSCLLTPQGAVIPGLVASFGRSRLDGPGGLDLRVVSARPVPHGNLAIGHLERAATGVTPIAMANRIPNARLGARVSGFGWTPDRSSRTSPMMITSLQVGRERDRTMTIAPVPGEDRILPCPQGRGAPVFQETESGPRLIAIISDTRSCTSRDERTRATQVNDVARAIINDIQMPQRRRGQFRGSGQ